MFGHITIIPLIPPVNLEDWARGRGNRVTRFCPSGKHCISFLSSFFPPGAGILAMANAGPDTNGSQFFVTLAPTQWLDGKHTIFGRVCQGIGMVNRVGMVETNSQDRPVDDVKIVKAYPSG